MFNPVIRAIHQASILFQAFNRKKKFAFRAVLLCLCSALKKPLKNCQTVIKLQNRPKSIFWSFTTDLISILQRISLTKEIKKALTHRKAELWFSFRIHRLQAWKMPRIESDVKLDFKVRNLVEAHLEFSVDIWQRRIFLTSLAEQHYKNRI